VRADGASREALDGAMTTLLGKVRSAPADHLADVMHAPGAHAAYEGNVAAPGTV
jgi:hypothetical protein